MENTLSINDIQLRIGDFPLPAVAQLFPDEESAYRELLKMAAEIAREIEEDGGPRVADKQFVRRVQEAWSYWRHYCAR